MTKLFQRSLSFFLALVMVFSMLPVGALADEAEPEEPTQAVQETAEQTQPPEETTVETTEPEQPVTEQPAREFGEDVVPEETPAPTQETEPAQEPEEDLVSQSVGMSQEEFQAATLAAAQAGVGYTLYDSVRLTSDWTTPCELNIQPGATLTVADGVTLHVSDFPNQIMIAGGTLHMESGSKLVTSGMIQLFMEGAQLLIEDGVDLSGMYTGAVWEHVGANATITGLTKGQMTGIYSAATVADINAAFANPLGFSQVSVYIRRDIALEQDIVVPANASLNLQEHDLFVMEGCTLTVNGLLRINPGRTLYVCQGATLQGKSNVEVDAGAAIEEDYVYAPASFVTAKWLKNDGQGFYEDLEEAAEDWIATAGVEATNETFMLFYLNEWDAQNNSWKVSPIIPETGSTYLEVCTVENEILAGQKNAAYFVNIRTRNTVDAQQAQLKYGDTTWRFDVEACRGGLFTTPYMAPDTSVYSSGSSIVLNPLAEENAVYLVIRDSESYTSLDVSFSTNDWGQNLDACIGDEALVTQSKEGNGVYKFTFSPNYVQWVRYFGGNFGMDVHVQGRKKSGDTLDRTCYVWVREPDAEQPLAVFTLGQNRDYYIFDGQVIFCSYATSDTDEWGNSIWKTERSSFPNGVSYDAEANKLTLNNATLDYLELWYFASWEDDQGQQSTTRLPDPALTLELLGENRIVKYASFDESVSLSIWGGVDITVTGGGSLTLPLGKGMNLDASSLTLTQGSTVKLFGHVWNNGLLDVADGKFILGSGADYDSGEDGELRGELAHEDGATFLSYRYLQQDDEGFWYVNMEDGPYTEFGMLSASRNCGIFYLNTWKEAQGKWIVEPVIPKTDSACLRISSFTGDMPIREGEENTAYFTVLDAVGTLDGEDTSIYVQKDGKELARTPFHIGQRRVDFYSSPVASVETLINRGDVMPEFRTSPEQDNVFYLILRNSEEQTLVTLNDRFECYYDYGQIFEDEKPYTMEPQGNGVYKITVHEEFAQYVQYDWRNFNLIVEAQFEGEDFTWGADIWVSPENMYSEKARIGINGSDYLFYEETSQIWRDYGTGEYDEEGNELWVREKTQLPEGVHYDLTTNTLTLENATLSMLDLFYDAGYTDENGEFQMSYTVSASGAALLNTGALLLNSGVLNVSGWNAMVAGYSADFGGESEHSRVQVGGGDQADGVLNITTNHIGILVNSMVEITGIAKVNVTLNQKDPTRGECAAIWVEKYTGNPDGTGENLSGLRLCAGANVNLVNKAEDGVGLYAAHSPVVISGFADGDGAYIYPTLSIEAEIPVSSVNASEQECNITLPDGWTFRDSKKALQFTAAEQADGSYCHTLKDSDGAVTVGTEKVTSVNTLEELMSLLKYVQDEDMYYLNQTVILEGNVSLADIALTIGGNLTIRGKLTMAGRLVVSGGTLDNQGVFILEKGAVLELHGTYQGSAPVNNGGQIYPMAETLELHARKTTLDISRMAQLELTMDKNALPYVTWTSSNKKIVDPADIVCNEDGTYTVPFAGKTLGKVTLTATAIDGSGKSDSVQLTVTGGKLTARLAQPVTGLQPEEFAGLLFFLGDEQVDPTWFSVTSSNETVVRVTHPQWSVVGVKPGTARITAVLENDPLKRKVTLNVKGIAPQVESLKVQYEDENGNNGTDNFAHAMYTDAAATLILTPLAVGSYLPADTQWSKRNFTWKSSDSKLVKLAVNNDGTATAMLQKGASGICTITVTSNDETKASATLTVTLKDYSPRLANTSVSLNPMSALGTQLELVETYGNKITAWSIAPNDKLEVKKSGDEYVLCAKKTDLKGTINATLSLEIENEETGKRETYEKNLKVSIRSSTPALTIKQTAKLDLFYSGSTAAFTVTAKNARVTNVTFVEEKNPSFVQVENGEDSSNLTIGFSQAFLNAPSTKPNTRITLLVEVEGYHPIEKTVTLATVTSKPALVSNPASSVLGGEARRVKLMLAEKASGESLDLTDAEITCMLGKQELVPILEDGCLVLEDCTAGTLNISVRMNGWNQSVKLSHRVKIENKLPTLKLAVSTLKLNSFAPDYAAITDVNLSQTNRSVTDMGAFTCSATDGIHVAFDPDTQTIAARLNPEAPAKNGTYTFTAEYYEVDGQRQDKKVTVKVNVAEIRPTAKLSSATVKLNTRLAGEEAGTVALTAKTVLGYDGRIDSVEVLTDWQEFDLDYADGWITVKLNTDKANVKRVYTLCPVVGDQKLAAVKLTLQSYDKAPSVSQSASGKLDLLLPDSAITYTIGKINNALGTVSGVSLADADGRIYPDGEAPFAVECVALANGKQGVRLTLVPGKVYAPNSSTRFRLIYSICGEQVPSSVLTAKITQSSVKLSAPAVTWFQSQKSPLKLTLSLTSPAGAQIGKIELNRNKTAKELLAALGGGEVAQAVSGSTGVLTLALENPASLAAGKSYSLTLDVTPAGAQTATSIRVTVKIAK